MFIVHKGFGQKIQVVTYICGRFAFWWCLFYTYNHLLLAKVVFAAYDSSQLKQN